MKTSEQCGGKKKGEERRNDENKFHARGKGKERKGGGGNGNSICGDIPKRIAERVVFPRKIQNRGAALFLTNGERERERGGNMYPAIYGGALTSSSGGWFGQCRKQILILACHICAAWTTFP